MKRGSEPIQAQRVFRLEKTPAGWRLCSTATAFVYHGPVAIDPVPPWTADEWSEISSAFADVVSRRRDSDGDWEAVTERLLNVPEADLVAWTRGMHPEKLALYNKRKDTAMHHGFHAFRPGQMDAGYAGYPVIGDVELFGRVVEYERGYRAQGVRIKNLTLRGIPDTRERDVWGISALALMFEPPRQPQGDPKQAPEIVRDLEAAYHCDVTEDWQRHRTEKKNALAQADPHYLYYVQPSYGTIHPWQTSDEKSKSTKSNWMRRTLHAIGKKMQSL